MQDLRHVCGLPVWLEDDQYTLGFGEGLLAPTPDVRRLEDLRPVLYNQTISEPEEIYYMYRSVSQRQERDALAARGLRFDLTVLPNRMLGQEFMKTAGHYHPRLPGSDLTYPELYQVVAGRAHFLLQKARGDGGILTDVVIVEADAGDYLLVPPGYGHITINPCDETLVLANWVDASFASLYQTMVKYRGGAFYEVKDNGQAVFVENERYQECPTPRMVKPGLPQIEGLKGDAIYQLSRDALGFLSDPAAYHQCLSKVLAEQDM